MNVKGKDATLPLSTLPLWLRERRARDHDDAAFRFRAGITERQIGNPRAPSGRSLGSDHVYSEARRGDVRRLESISGMRPGMREPRGCNRAS